MMHFKRLEMNLIAWYLKMVWIWDNQ
jgi:hypothetical protein